MIKKLVLISLCLLFCSCSFNAEIKKDKNINKYDGLCGSGYKVDGIDISDAKIMEDRFNDALDRLGSEAEERLAYYFTILSAVLANDPNGWPLDTKTILIRCKKIK